MFTADQNPQTKELQVTMDLEPSTGALEAGVGPGEAHPTPSQEATKILLFQGGQWPGDARHVSRLKASDGFEEAGEASREAFKRGSLFQAPPEAGT